MNFDESLAPLVELKKPSVLVPEGYENWFIWKFAIYLKNSIIFHLFALSVKNYQDALMILTN